MPVTRDEKGRVTAQPLVWSGTEEELQGAMDWFNQQYAAMEPWEKEPGMSPEELAARTIWEWWRLKHYFATAEFWRTQLKLKRARGASA